MRVVFWGVVLVMSVGSLAILSRPRPQGRFDWVCWTTWCVLAVLCAAIYFVMWWL